MYSYKVEFLETSIAKSTWKDTVRGEVDGRTTSKDLEAMLLEKDKEGYELVSVVPTTGVVKISSTVHHVMTAGFMVTFRKKDEPEG